MVSFSILGNTREFSQLNDKLNSLGLWTKIALNSTVDLNWYVSRDMIYKLLVEKIPEKTFMTKEGNIPFSLSVTDQFFKLWNELMACHPTFKNADMNKIKVENRQKQNFKLFFPQSSKTSLASCHTNDSPVTLTFNFLDLCQVLFKDGQSLSLRQLVLTEEERKQFMVTFTLAKPNPVSVYDLLESMIKEMEKVLSRAADLIVQMPLVQLNRSIQNGPSGQKNKKVGDDSPVPKLPSSHFVRKNQVPTAPPIDPQQVRKELRQKKMKQIRDRNPFNPMNLYPKFMVNWLHKLPPNQQRAIQQEINRLLQQQAKNAAKQQQTRRKAKAAAEQAAQAAQAVRAVQAAQKKWMLENPSYHVDELVRHLANVLQICSKDWYSPGNWWYYPSLCTQNRALWIYSNVTKEDFVSLVQQLGIQDVDNVDQVLYNIVQQLFQLPPPSSSNSDFVSWLSRQFKYQDRSIQSIGPARSSSGQFQFKTLNQQRKQNTSLLETRERTLLHNLYQLRKLLQPQTV